MHLKLRWSNFKYGNKQYLRDPHENLNETNCTQQNNSRNWVQSKKAIDHLAVKIRKDISRHCDNFRDLNQQATIEAKIDCPFLIKALFLSYS